MPDNSATIPPKGLGSLQWHDLLKGIYYAVIGQVLYLIGYFFSSLLQEHPQLPTWVGILPYVKAIGVTIGGYIVGKLGVNNVGQILQKDKPIVHVDADALDELKAKADLLSDGGGTRPPIPH